MGLLPSALLALTLLVACQTMPQNRRVVVVITPLDAVPAAK